MEDNKKPTAVDALNKIEASQAEKASSPEVEDITISDETRSLAREAELEQEYGDSSLETGALGVASGLTFGLSDQALVKSGIYSQEELRELNKRNKLAAVTGEVIGTVAPLLATGGTSAVAKGVATAGKGVTAASKTGILAEKAMAKLLKESAKDKIAKSVLKKSISKGTGSAVEGAFYGAGQLVKEDALGTADFNAENLAAHVGTGALLGGAAGGVFGTAEALVPVVKNNKIVDWAKKKVPTGDAKEAAAELSGLTPSKITKVKQRSPDVFENLPEYYRTRIKLDVKDNAKAIHGKNETALKSIGKEIDDTLTKIDEVADVGQKLTKDEVARNHIKLLDELREDFAGVTGRKAESAINRIEDEIESFLPDVGNIEFITAKEIADLKRKYQKIARYDKAPGVLTLEDKISRTHAKATRQNMLDLADRVSTVDDALGQQLRKQNLDYGTAMTIADSLEKKVDKEAAKNWVQFKDMLLGNIFLGADAAGLGAIAIGAKRFAESDLRRKIQVLSTAEKANQAITKKVSNSIKNFFTKARKVSVPTSTKILLNTSYSADKKKRSKSSSRKEGYKRIKEELTEIQSNPQAFVERLGRNSLRMTNAAPMTAEALNMTIFRATQFLSEKLPRPKQAQGTIQSLTKDKEYVPSTLELAKFERYVEAVENPMSVLDDLESGRLSREKIEAVQAVYPNIYARIQNEAMNYIQENPEKISYPKRLQLGILLDIPADSALLPENIARYQSIYDEEQEAQQGAVNTTQTGVSNIDKASSVASGTEKVANRK